MARPYMPLYVGDYLRDTRRLSLEEHGAYLLLMMEYWATGNLPENDEKIARILGISQAKWLKLKGAIKPFFKEGWKHKRIDEELAQNADKSQKRSGAAKVRWSKKPDANAYANAYASEDAMHMLPNQTIVIDKSITLLSETDVSEQSKKTKKVKGEYSDEFEEFWKAYPTDKLMSKKKAAANWSKLTTEQQAKATQSTSAFRAYCASHPDYRPVHACRYLSEERFEGFAQTTTQTTAAAMCVVRQETPQGRAWDEYSRATKGKGVPWTNGVWRFPSEYPPTPTGSIEDRITEPFLAI